MRKSTGETEREGSRLRGTWPVPVVTIPINPKTGKRYKWCDNCREEVKKPSNTKVTAQRRVARCDAPRLGSSGFVRVLSLFDRLMCRFVRGQVAAARAAGGDAQKQGVVKEEALAAACRQYEQKYGVFRTPDMLKELFRRFPTAPRATTTT